MDILEQNRSFWDFLELSEQALSKNSQEIINQRKDRDALLADQWLDLIEQKKHCIDEAILKEIERLLIAIGTELAVRLPELIQELREFYPEILQQVMLEQARCLDQDHPVRFILKVASAISDNKQALQLSAAQIEALLLQSDSDFEQESSESETKDILLRAKLFVQIQGQLTKLDDSLHC